MSQFLFVYGSLRSEYPYSDIHSYLLSYSQFYAYGTINGKLYLKDFYPCLVENETQEVKGEIYKLLEPNTLLPELDDYEDFQPTNETDSLFVRRKLKVKTDKKNLIDAWVYIFNKPTDGLIELPSGDFIEYYEQNLKS